MHLSFIAGLSFESPSVRKERTKRFIETADPRHCILGTDKTHKSVIEVVVMRKNSICA